MPMYRYTGEYASEIVSEGKSVPVGWGDFIEIAEDDMSSGVNAIMFTEGQLIDVEPEGDETGPPSPPVEVIPEGDA